MSAWDPMLAPNLADPFLALPHPLLPAVQHINKYVAREVRQTVCRLLSPLLQ